MNRFDAIICDNDGCLTAEDTSPFDLAALSRIAEHNAIAARDRDRPVLTLCSGRPIPFVEAMCRLLANDVLPAIAENGVWIYDPRTNAMELDPRINTEHLEAVHEMERWIAADFEPKGVDIQPGKRASVSLWHADTEYLRTTVCDTIRDRAEREAWPFRVSMTWFYINCDLNFITKGTAIERLIERDGLDRTRLAGIGDTPSDVAIAERVAWFGCPANASPEIRERADYVASKPEAQGVLELLNVIDAMSVAGE